MKQLIFVVVLCHFLPGRAVFGIALAGVATENVASGEDSYSNQALDYTCDRTTGSARRADGDCPGN